MRREELKIAKQRLDQTSSQIAHPITCAFDRSSETGPRDLCFVFFVLCATFSDQIVEGSSRKKHERISAR